MWQIASLDGKRWVRWQAGGDVDASPDMRPFVYDAGPVEIAPMTGCVYRPAGADDPVGIFLRARRIIGDNNIRVAGDPPVLPPVVAPVSPGAVY